MATRGSVARASGPRNEHRPPLQPDAGAAASTRRLGPRVPPARAGCSGPAGLLMAPPRALPPAPRALKPRAAPSGRPCRRAQQAYSWPHTGKCPCFSILGLGFIRDLGIFLCNMKLLFPFFYMLTDASNFMDLRTNLRKLT